MTSRLQGSATQWRFSGLAPGVYSFGTSPLTGMPTAFANAPIILDQKTNDSDYYVSGKSGTGFVIVDRQEGEIPTVNVLIIQN